MAEELATSKVVACVTGGDSRAASVAAALVEVPEELSCRRSRRRPPLVDDAVVERVLEPLARGFDGVVPCFPVPDTLKRVHEGTVAETVDRAGLVAAQTPQAFLSRPLRRAFEGDLAGATDCASLVERAGGRVAAVEGDPRLQKVTTVDDLALVGRSSRPA